MAMCTKLIASSLFAIVVVFLSMKYIYPRHAHLFAELLITSSLFAIVVVFLSMKYMYPRQAHIFTNIFFLRFAKNTFTYWMYHEYRHQKLPSKGTFSDKLFAKKYVESIYSDEMNVKWAKLLFVGVPTMDDLKRLKASHEAFVIKANHGCKWNIIVTKDNHLMEQDMSEYIGKCSSWLNQTYGKGMLRKMILGCEELQYQYIEPKVFIEQYLGDDIVDYKLHTVNGKVELVEVNFDRAVREANGQFVRVNFYGVKPWRILDGVSNTFVSYNDPKTQIKEPPHLDTMIAFAEAFTSAHSFAFCRVDLFIVDNQVYFGEFTFSPAGDCIRWYPLSFEQRWFEKVLHK
eukprot:326606_1